MAHTHPNNIVGLCTQNVGVGTGGTIPMLARVTLIDFRGNTIHDFYVAPTTFVTDYRTETTGITSDYLDRATPFDEGQRYVASVIDGKILVGYELGWSLRILGLQHKLADTRDMRLYEPFLSHPDIHSKARLATMTMVFLHRRIQFQEEDNSVENARASMDLYRSVRSDCEGAIAHSSWPFVLPQGYDQQFF